MASFTAPMWRHRRLQLERIEKFVSPVYFADANLHSRVDLLRSQDGVHLELFSPPSGVHPTWAQAHQHLQWMECKPGSTVLGPAWSTHWIRATINVPDTMHGYRETLVFEFDPSCEALVWTNDGHPHQGITGGDDRARRVEIPLAPLLPSNGYTTTLWLEVACNGLFGVGANGMINPPDPTRSFLLKTADLVVPNVEVRQLLRALEVIEGIGKHLHESSERGQKALFVANSIINECWPEEAESVRRALAQAHEFLAAPASAADHTLHVIGHCHIDTAWLWTYRETRRKAGRSWSSQVRLMETHPEFTFACSQAQQLAWLKKDYPHLFQQIQTKAKQGQFIPVGGTWVEMDCNIPNGESLVRQFLLGQRFFQEHFGERCRIFWLPDTFGYAAQLPQIMQSAGCEFFMSQKISWNLINSFPFTSFYWRGIDGSTVLAHFPPSDTYNGQATVQEAIFAVTNNRDRDRTSCSLQLIGNGDGGGGPQLAMLERTHLMSNTLGIPRMKFSTPNNFFDQLRLSKDLHTWHGELYLELHRGTYTTQSFVKAGNRQIEALLHDVETASVLATINVPGFVYPRAALDRIWKLFLLQQFHDVIPGTSIDLVYDDVRKHYAEIETEANDLLVTALEAIARTSALSGHKLLIFNGAGCAQNGLITMSATQAPLLSRDMITQPDTVKAGQILVGMGSIPAMGLSSPVSQQPVAAGLEIQTEDTLFVLRNQFVDAGFDAAGRLVRWHWVAGGNKWSLLPSGHQANIFAMYEDIPLYWDAWDLELYHREKRLPLDKTVILNEAQVVENGPLRVAIAFTLQIGSGCTIRQVVSLTASSALLRFDTVVEWSANRRILKVEHAMDITTDSAIYETQFGQIRRPIAANTSWDAAKFEVCGHRYAALCEANFGIALLNDCKYGYSVLPSGKGLALSLLRAPKAPDNTADMGAHTFAYGLLPFEGTLQMNRLVQQALAFNSPPRVFIPTRAANADVSVSGAVSLGQCTSADVVLDTVKLAEDTDDAVVVRLYEPYGGRARTVLQWARSAITLGYMRDDFLPFFVKRPARRPPLINRGYYAREYAIRHLVNAFLEQHKHEPSQVLCLGAGFDTRFFQLRSSNARTDLVRYFEVDFPEVTQAKIDILRIEPVLQSLVPGAQFGDNAEPGDFSSPHLVILGGDLRQFDVVREKLIGHGFDSSRPTLVLSECVLIYLKREHADQIIHWAGSELDRSVFVCYEQIRPDDAFGEVMLRNLESRGIILQSIHDYPDLMSQRERYRVAGFEASTVRDMLSVYDEHIPHAEKQRVNRLEFLDEVEEWRLIMQHYCFVWASRGIPHIEWPYDAATANSKTPDSELEASQSLPSVEI